MLLLVDNYDSFTYNIYQGLAAAGAPVKVARNDAITVQEVLDLQPQAVVLSPGPGHPKDAGICLDLIEKLDPRVPMLGVCLGHQALVLAYGGELEVDKEPVHGIAYPVHHELSALLDGCPSPFQAGRYHSLRAKRSALPEELKLVGWTEDGIVMAIEHNQHPRYGIQFHPESILTPQGQRIHERFLAIAGFAVGGR